jgi:hypothetical protein
VGTDGLLGTLVLQRRKPGEFPAAIVSQMQSFADQSAIALEMLACSRRSLIRAERPCLGPIDSREGLDLPFAGSRTCRRRLTRSANQGRTKACMLWRITDTSVSVH